MSHRPQPHARPRLDPEKVAYWYFRLNGFLQIENFVIHPEGRGGQRTDADLVGMRFPYRAERLIDDPDDIMQDDERSLLLSDQFLDVIIAEVKTNQPCHLNGPWTNKDMQNIHRVLAAIGCVPIDKIEFAAAEIYRNGWYNGDRGLRVRLVAVGRSHNEELAKQYPAVVQLSWPTLLGFIWNRFHAYRRQKKDVDQWDKAGRLLKQLADRSNEPAAFIEEALRHM